MSKKLPWFRAYTEMVDDEKLRLLAFEDRWHFVALLCLKGQGVLDESDALLFRKVAVKLGVDMRTLEEVARRLAEVGLIDEKTLQPLAWDSRQFKSDSSAERVAAYRERKKQAVKRDGNVTVTAQDTDTETDTDKNPLTPLAGGESPTAEKPKPSRKPRIQLKTFIENCKKSDEKPISEYQPLLDYVEATGLPMEYIQLAWEVFKDEFMPGGANENRLQADWRRHFLNYVKKGYYRLWFAKPAEHGTEYSLSTQGMQAKSLIAHREGVAA